VPHQFIVILLNLFDVYFLTNNFPSSQNCLLLKTPKAEPELLQEERTNTTDTFTPSEGIKDKASN